MPRKLTAKQESFKNNRVKGMSRIEAYLASTYSTDNMSKTSIYAEALRLDNHPLISQAVEKAKEKALSASIMTREEALQRLTLHARVKVTDVCDFKFQCIGQDADGQDIMRTVWTVKNSDDIDPDIAACIKSVTMGKDGPKIELHDNDKAINQLRAMEGWDAPKLTALTDNKGNSVPLNINVNAPEVAEALAAMMDKL
jgi:phage terminase small subunit